MQEFPRSAHKPIDMYRDLMLYHTHNYSYRTGGGGGGGGADPTWGLGMRLYRAGWGRPASCFGTWRVPKDEARLRVGQVCINTSLIVLKSLRSVDHDPHKVL